MLGFRFQNNTVVIFGKDTELQTGTEVAKYATKILLCSYDEPVLEAVVGRVKMSLIKANIEFVELMGIQPNPKEDRIRDGIELARVEKVEFILAVGGGSVIDTAKAIAAGVKYSGDFWDLFKYRIPVKDALPVGVVSTHSASGSETSTTSVVTNRETENKLSIYHSCLRPKFAILNPELTHTLSKYQTFCGVVDLMSHVMERYFSSTTYTDLSDHLLEAILRTAIKNGRILLETPDNPNARAEIMWAAALSHNDLLGCGREPDWVSHMIGAELSAIYDSVHGATLSVITPHWARHVYKHNIGRFVQFATRVFNIDNDIDNPERTAIRGVDALESLFRELGMPTTLHEIDITSDERFTEMAEKVVRNGPVGSIKPITSDDCMQILRASI
ncbi:iron-containing alcohol dehydrogenase [Candidatus Pacearchaeota archaeon]|nr:iron-containing alcohol dehydrogenase [Candidatus Pacearchaeota archaeon]